MAFAYRLKVLGSSVVAGIVCYGGWKTYSHEKQDVLTLEASGSSGSPAVKEVKPKRIPSRFEQLEALQEGKEYEVLIIGGGVTGCGIALDSTLRGFETALVEKFDFASGTSSRSTKLIHGGVRYLEKAFFNLDYEQYRLVKEALHERANLLKIAPHLAHPLPIMLPVYKWWQVPYYYAGIKMYDLVAGKQLVKKSYYLSKSKALEEFPMLKAEKLCGALVYYDGQMNDSRMNVALAMTAAREGATVGNHVEVISLIKEETIDKSDNTSKMLVKGAHVRDRLTGKEWDIRAKVVVNATGPFSDSIRLMDNPSASNMVQPSAGIHIVLPEYYSPHSMGLLDPATSDGRVIFFLPWQGKTIAGTTDSPIGVTHMPAPQEEDIKFILTEVKNYLSPNISVRRGDVEAAWSGIRPLVIDPNKKDTQSIARNHIIEVSEGNLVTIAGGKWTTYRSMAEDTVDKLVEVSGFEDKGGCRTNGFMLDGGEDWHPTNFIRLVQDYGIDVEVAKHLSHSYGNRAAEVARLASLTGKRWPLVGKKLSEEFPYLEAEVKYSMKEYASTVVDVLARRTRLAFLNVQIADEVVPRIVEMMGKELGWDKARRKAEDERARLFLQSMGLKVATEVRDAPINLSYQEAKQYSQIFKNFDKDRDGHIGIHDLRKALQEMGEKVDDDELRGLIAEVDINKNATIEEEEFLQLMSALKSGEVTHLRLGSIIEAQKRSQEKITVDRSGGGL